MDRLSIAPPRLGRSWLLPDLPYGLAFAAFAAIAFSSFILQDGDSFLHIAAGQWMLDHGRIPDGDPFSATLAGHPWQAHEWLSEVVLALAFRLAGLPAVMLLTALALGASVLLVVRYVTTRLQPIYAVLVLLIAAELAARAVLARPHMLVMPLMIIAAIEAIEAANQDRRPSFWLAGVFTLWANMHASFPVGLGVMAALGAETAWRNRSVTLAARWAGVGLAATLATMVSPYGVNTLIFPFVHSANVTLAFINEWQPTELWPPNVLELAFGLVILALAAGVRPSPFRLMLIAGLAYLAIEHQRHHILFGLYTTLIIAGSPLGRLAVVRGERDQDQEPAIAPVRRPAGVPAWGWAAGVLVVAAVRIATPAPSLDGKLTPMTTLAALPDELRQAPVFNDYNFGGPMIFYGLRPAIDSRVELFGAEGLNNYDRRLTDRCALLDDFVTRGVRWSILEPDNPVLATIDSLPGWHRLSANEFAVVNTGPRLHDRCPG
ncbi:MAG: hypothetical protein P4L82_16405 [Ancalomicrobiaceae bacterium]|nr:hypothetical protein [Ancalomicrobiaceae bacterium]